jgi:hypothetical protein
MTDNKPEQQLRGVIGAGLRKVTDKPMDKEDLYNWEKMSLSNIILLMVKWFNFDNVTMEVQCRPNVESGVWWNLKIEQDGKTYYVTGQRTDIVRRRLIEILDSLEIRKHYLNEQNAKP